jgi:hypothetical protein
MSSALPEVTQVQVSGRDEEGRWILSVLAKRTYWFGADQPCALAKEQACLVLEPRYAPDKPGVLLADIDTWPYKKRTDVVVIGKVYNHREQPSFVAGIRLGGFEKGLNVFGDRRCMLDHVGRTLFSKPTVVANVPLSYEFSFGGRDRIAEAKHGNFVDDIREFISASEVPSALLDEASPFSYPRNPCGRGYLVEATKEALEGLALPNLEYPGDQRLTPENMVAGTVDAWPRLPLPASLGWLDFASFPRLAWLGIVPEHHPTAQARDFHEVRLGHAMPDILANDERPCVEGANGASLGLRLPHVASGESVELVNLHPKRESVRFRLPTEKPRLWVDGRNGKMLATQPVMHSLIIEPDENRLSIVWRGSGAALRPYLDKEIDSMPFIVEW